MVKPGSIVLKEGYDDVSHSVLVVEPLSRGFGATIGNSLRRVLLSSISGFAVTSVRIEGVLHEYALIDGVKEDVVEILMNVKSLAISSNLHQSFSMILDISSSGPVYAGSINTPPGIDIVNKDLLICTLSENSSIKLEMKVEYGKGYAPSDCHTKSILPSNYIALDASFSPVLSVCYKAESSRVGNVTDFDRLVLDIVTNGTISPKDAVSVAAKILQDQLKYFIGFDINDFSSEEVVVEKVDFNPNLLKRVDELELSVRAQNCLNTAKIDYVFDLVQRTDSDMLKCANFGKKSLNELKLALSLLSLSLGMQLANWPPKNIEKLLDLKNGEF